MYRILYFIFSVHMAPYTLRRWDEPHLFDALATYFRATSSFVGDEYGDAYVPSGNPDAPDHVVFGFSDSFTTLRMVTNGSYWTVEDEALKWYNEHVDPCHAAQAEAECAEENEPGPDYQEQEEIKDEVEDAEAKLSELKQMIMGSNIKKD